MMRWKLPALGAAISFLFMMLAARKWKIPKRSAMIGAMASSFAAALPFVWLDSLCKSSKAKAAAMFGQVALAFAFAITLIMRHFWRDPERIAPEEKDIVLAPADGKILYIKTIDKGSIPLVTKHGRNFLLQELVGMNLMDNGAYVIGVEMNLLDVHVNRCPIDGQVKFVNHIEGTFISLGRAEAQFKNERCITVIENPIVTLAVAQVASRLVRRIDNYLYAGQMVRAGQRLGMIRFGSLVAVVLPKRENIKLEAIVGNRVTAGVSILARSII